MSRNTPPVLFVTRPLAPPWDEASKNFARDLARNIVGRDIHILTVGRLDDTPENVIQHPIYTDNVLDTCQKIRSLAFQFASRRRFPIVHYFFTPTRQNAFLIRNIIKCRGIRYVQTVATLREDLYSTEDLKRTIFGNTLIAYTEHSGSKLRSMGFRDVHVIPPGIDLDTYSKKDKDQALLKELRVDRSDFIVAYPGEYVRLGATETLVKFLRAYFGKYPDSNLKFLFANRIKNADDGRMKKRVVETLDNAGLTDKVRFTDTLRDMQKLYNLCDTIAFPVENLHGKFDVPLVIPEAQACEKPVILSDIGQFSEFTRADNSVIVKRGDVDDLCMAVERLRTDPIARDAMGRRAREWALDRFSIRRVAERYERLYDSLTSEARP